jgi:hypothetical protein
LLDQGGGASGQFFGGEIDQAIDLRGSRRLMDTGGVSWSGSIHSQPKPLRRAASADDEFLAALARYSESQLISVPVRPSGWAAEKARMYL